MAELPADFTPWVTVALVPASTDPDGEFCRVRLTNLRPETLYEVRRGEARGAELPW